MKTESHAHARTHTMESHKYFEHRLTYFFATLANELEPKELAEFDRANHQNTRGIGIEIDIERNRSNKLSRRQSHKNDHCNSAISSAQPTWDTCCG